MISAASGAWTMSLGTSPCGQGHARIWGLKREIKNDRDVGGMVLAYNWN